MLEILYLSIKDLVEDREFFIDHESQTTGEIHALKILAVVRVTARINVASGVSQL